MVAIAGFGQAPPPIPTFPAPPASYAGAALTLGATVTGGSGAYSFQWSQIYGPSPAMIATPTAQTTGLVLIYPGTYVIRCTIVDQADSTQVAYSDYVTTLSAGYYTASQIPQNWTVKVDTIPPASTDTTAPVIKSITRLVGSSYVDGTTGPGATITGLNNVTLRVNATDNVGVWSAQLIVDNWQVAFMQGAGDILPTTFDIKWTDVAIKAGTHNARIRVCDSAANCSQQVFTLTK